MQRQSPQLPQHVDISALAAASQRSDHDAQLNVDAKSISINLQGPYAIKKNIRSLPDGTRGNQWSLDLPPRQDGTSYTLSPNDTRRTNINPEELSYFTGKPVAWCAEFISVLLKDNQNNSSTQAQSFLSREKDGLGDGLGVGKHRICIEDYEQYSKRMNMQIAELKSSVPSDSLDVICLQEQPYDLDDDKVRKQKFNAIMEAQGYVQKAYAPGRDVGIWVKKGNEDRYKVIHDKFVSNDDLRGCIVQDTKTNNVYINVHVDRCESDKLVDMMEQLMRVAQRYAGKSGKIAIHGDFNLFKLDEKYVQRLVHCGYTVEPVKNTEALQKIFKNRPDFKPNYEAHTGLRLAVAIRQAAQSQPLGMRMQMQHPQQTSSVSTKQIDSVLSSNSNKHSQHGYNNEKNDAAYAPSHPHGVLRKLDGMKQNDEEYALANSGLDRAEQQGNMRKATEMQAKRIFESLLENAKQYPDRKFAFIYSADLKAYKLFNDSYERNDAKLPALSFDSSGQSLLFAYLIKIINEAIDAKELEAGLVRILPIPTIKYTYDIRTEGYVPSNVTKQELDQGIESIKQNLDDGYSVFGISRRDNIEEYSIGGGVSHGFMKRDPEFDNMTRNEYVQQALRQLEQEYSNKHTNKPRQDANRSRSPQKYREEDVGIQHPRDREQQWQRRAQTAQQTSKQQMGLARQAPQQAVPPPKEPQQIPWMDKDAISAYRVMLDSAQRKFDPIEFKRVEDEIIAGVVIMLELKGIKNVTDLKDAPYELRDLLKMSYQHQPATKSKQTFFGNIPSLLGFKFNPSSHASMNTGVAFIDVQSRMMSEIDNQLQNRASQSFRK